MTEVAVIIKKIVDVFHENNQPFNLLIRDQIIHLIPRQIESSIAQTEIGFGPAMVELFGVYIVKSEEIWK